MTNISHHPIQEDPGFKDMYNIKPGNELTPAVTTTSVQREMSEALDAVETTFDPTQEENAQKSKLGRKLAVAAGLTVGTVGIATGVNWVANQAEKSIIADTYVPTEAQRNNAQAGLEAVQSLPENPSDLVVEVDTAPYTVQPGDTAWNLAKGVEANIDGVADNQDVRPFVDDIMEQANKDGNPGLQAGEVIQMPAAADRHLGPGYQDSSK